MNRFKLLDSLFPCGAERRSGEVVTTDITVVSYDGTTIGNIWMKRKAWYVNASVNAFHMHRDLCVEFRRLYGCGTSRTDAKRAYSLIGDAVMAAYLINHRTGLQWSRFSLFVGRVGTRDPLPTLCVDNEFPDIIRSSDVEWELLPLSIRVTPSQDEVARA